MEARWAGSLFFLRKQRLVTLKDIGGYQRLCRDNLCKKEGESRERAVWLEIKRVGIWKSVGVMWVLLDRHVPALESQLRRNRGVYFPSSSMSSWATWTEQLRTR